jgi:Na+/phosphate symporter
MRIVGIAWYLFGLLVAAALLESAITYAPSARHMGNVILGATVVFAGVFGLGATWLTIKRKRNPESQVFRSKPASIVAMCVAVIMTLIVLFGVVG